MTGKRVLRAEVLRFGVVGVTASVSYSLIMAGIARVPGLPIFAASVILFALFIPVTFLAHRKFTFRSQAIRRSAFANYAMLQIGCFAALSSVSTNFVSGSYGADSVLYFVTVGAAAVVSFLVGKLFVFRPWAEGAQQSEARDRKQG